MFEKILIANRGEIALRVARTCRELGIRTVGVHSTADADADFVRFADESVCIGPPPPKASYLNMAAVLQAAAQTNADAIHPGYGFLSEDADFAEACRADGVGFIGPSPELMKQIADKAVARARMAEAGLPMLPGSVSELATEDDVRRAAGRTGYPLIIKATAGGGGRGMRVVHEAGELLDAYWQNRANARRLFGHDGVYLERFLTGPRHVEVQVLADHHGNTVHLGERDCSVQRRHQKLIEETPASGLSAGLRDRMTAAAVAGARHIGYQGAGTFEFLVDDRHEFYFMEINCRIQVEHPVTEAVTGIDLIREQILVAAGQPLSLRQQDIHNRGAAIEIRVQTEDPAHDFRPTAGRLDRFAVPGGPFTRVDTATRAGASVPPFYDSLLAKLIVWAPDRAQALARADRALSEFDIHGENLSSTVDFTRTVLADPDFRNGRHDTGLVGRLTENQGESDGHR
ncbi:MAG TPA: acetyl-CoA carboxylase biotin carboxylase subunit [Pseudonocardiaceae bacterium]|jgi:acetyl-CoA carboxylase biotin carboxylase subunit|nr:acetyl-CoA carboxylase biotin carboxylase subunit [Pseudonocardiaceae bacterium]